MQMMATGFSQERRATRTLTTQTVAFVALTVGMSAIGITPMQTACMLAFGCWIVWRLTARARDEWPANPLLIPILLYGLVALIVALFSVDVGNSLKGVRQLAQIALILVVGDTVTREREVRVLIGTWIGVAAVVSVYAVGQYLHGTGRVHAFFDGPMTLVRVLVLVTAVGMALAVTSRGGTRYFALACLVPTIPALVLTFSRAGWLTLGITALFLGAVRRSRILIGGVLLGLCLMAVTARLYPETVTGSLIRSIVRPMDPSLERFQSTFQRYWMYRSALHVFRAHPLTGVGQRNFGKASGQYIPEELRDSAAVPPGRRAGAGYAHAHSLYLNLLATQGLLGLAAFLWLIGTAVRLAVRNYRRAQETYLKAVSLGVLAAMVAFLALGCIDENSRDSESIMPLWFLIGISLAIHRIEPDEAAPAPTGHPPGGLSPACELVPDPGPGAG